MRRYTVALCAAEAFHISGGGGGSDGGGGGGGGNGVCNGGAGSEGGVDLSNKFAHATNHCVQKQHPSAVAAAAAGHHGVGRRWLIVSKPVLKAPMVSRAVQVDRIKSRDESAYGSKGGAG